MPMPSMTEIGGMIAATTVATCSVLRCTAAAQSAGRGSGGMGAIEAAADALRAELGALSLREVRRRAEQGGVSADRVDEALETTSPKRATIELILQHRQQLLPGSAKPKSCAERLLPAAGCYPTMPFIHPPAAPKKRLQEAS